MNKKLEQFKAFKKLTGKSLQYLINEVCQILKNPIILYDINLKVLAYDEGNAVFWGNFTNNGNIKRELVDYYINEGSYNDITSPMRQVMFLDNERLKHHGIYGKIYDKNNLPIALINLVEITSPIEKDDLTVVKALCKMLSDEICKIPYYQNFSQIQLDNYINKLINSDIDDKIYASVYIAMIYKGLKNNLYVAVADIVKCDPTYSKLNYYRDLFKQVRPAFKYSIHSNYIVMIMSTDRTAFYPQKSFGSLNKLFEQEKITVGISSCFENLFNLQRYYNEAVEALKGGLTKDRGKHIFVYNKNVKVLS